jgi:hypothetical protein
MVARSTFFSSRSFRSIFAELGYELPSHDMFAGIILNECYDDVLNKVRDLVANSDSINIVTDESTNVLQERVSNLNFITPDGCLFFWKSIVRADVDDNVTQTSQDIIDTLCDMTGNDLRKINSITMDTCTTMRLSWKVLAQHPELRHCFFVPCNSRGLRFVMKDILQLPKIRNFWKGLEIS